MGQIQLDWERYLDKVYACWMGKNIGGTLGTPLEGKKEVHSLTFYDPVPDRPLPNDDLDFQLVWLRMLLDGRIDPWLDDFSEYWLRHLSAYPWNEYGFCARNLEMGLRPPVSGCFENYFVDEMGSPIRSEIWACVSPGDPQTAASLAWRDSALDHAGGEGTYGEMFWAAVESAAFVLDDPQTLIRIGLSMIPSSSLIHRSVREVLWCRRKGLSWIEARNRILHCFGHAQPCNAPQNHGFTVIGLLYGRDFGDKLCTAVNCGYDTDCTGATLGSLLGIVNGSSGIPSRWSEPIGEEIVLHKFTKNLKAPRDVRELTELTGRVARRRSEAGLCSTTFGDADVIPGDALSILFRNHKALAAARRDPQSSIVRRGSYELSFHYMGDPVVYPGVEKEVAVSLEKDGSPQQFRLDVELPEGWVGDGSFEYGSWKVFRVKAPSLEKGQEIGVKAKLDGEDLTERFLLLSPSDLDPYGCSLNVPTCPRCGGRLGSCICEG